MADPKSYNYDHQRTLNPLSILLCFMGLIAVAFSSILRVIPNVVPDKILALLYLTPNILNQLNATYQYPLIATLVLSGICIDLIGPRTVLVITICLAMAANLLFSISNSMTVIMASRIIIGFTYPFILTSVLTLGTHWLPRRHFSTFVGLLCGTFLMTPTLVATPVFNSAQPLLTITSYADLIRTAVFVDFLGFLAVISILLTQPVIDKTRYRFMGGGLFKPLTQYKVWMLGVVSMIGWMANTFFLRLGAFYLSWDFNFTTANANKIVTISFICFGVGSIIMGVLSDFLKRKRYLITISYIIAAILISVVFFTPDIPGGLATWLFCITAFLTSSSIICFTKANDYCTIGNSGITLGLILSITTIGSSYFATYMHSLVEYSVNHATPDGGTNLRIILIIIPVILMLGAILSVTLLKPVKLKPVLDLETLKRESEQSN